MDLSCTSAAGGPTLDGLGALLTVNGAVKGDVFAVRLDQVLGPSLPPGASAVLDKLAAHEVDGRA